MTWIDSEQRRRAVSRHLAALLREATLRDEFEMMHPRGRLGRWVDVGMSRYSRGARTRNRRRSSVMNLRGVPGGEPHESRALATLDVQGQAGLLPGPRKVVLTDMRRGRFGAGGMSPMQVRNRKAEGLPTGLPEAADAKFHGLARDDKGLYYVWTQIKGRKGHLTPAAADTDWMDTTSGGTEYAALPGHEPMTATLPRDPESLARQWEQRQQQAFTAGPRIEGQLWLYGTKKPMPRRVVRGLPTTAPAH